MNRNTKIALIVVGVLLLLCVCSCGLFFVSTQYLGASFAQSIATEPADVAAVGAKIAEYDVPAGYTDNFGMSFLIFDMVGFGKTDANNDTFIFMMQFPEWTDMDPETMQQQMQQSIQEQTNDSNVQFQVIEQKTIIIRDQEVLLTTQEGTNDEGKRIRQMIGMFQGNGGPTMLMIMGGVDTWNQATVDTFIDSIR